MSLEQSIKEQYEKIFLENDWNSFKDSADYYFENAAKLRKKNIEHSNDGYKLLRRNSLKRLYIGIGCELLLKAIYLKNGFYINKNISNKDSICKFSEEYNNSDFKKSDTLTLNQLIDNIKKITDINLSSNTIDGLKIAKVFRNKEGHIISLSHEYISENYRVIEESLKTIYRDFFSEDLSILISFGRGEKPLFKIEQYIK